MTAVPLYRTDADALAAFGARLRAHMRSAWDVFRQGRGPRPPWWTLLADPADLTAGDDALAEALIRGLLHPAALAVAGQLHALGYGLDVSAQWARSDLAGASRRVERGRS